MEPRFNTQHVHAECLLTATNLFRKQSNNTTYLNLLFNTIQCIEPN